LRESITVPARLVGLEFEAGLVDRILSDVGIEPGRLPLVEFALTEIWQRREGRRLTNKAYDEIKGVSGALARRAEAEFARLNPEEQTGAQRLFSRLVRVAKPDEAGEDTRQRAELFESDRLMKHVAKRLADARLLVTSGETGTGTISVEVAHEVLIGNWKRLRNWLNDAREFLLWRQRLNGLLAEWERAQESDEAVLRGPLLIEAQKWSDQRSQDLSDQERKFISASREKRERLVRDEKERQQRELAEAEKRRLEQAAAAKSLRRLAWVLAAVAFAALGGAIFGFWQRNEAENRRHDADVAKAEANHAHDLADGLINFMLFDLSQKLSAIGRLDILDDVGKKAQDYLQKLPKDVITKSRQQQESAVLLNLGDIYRLRGNVEKAHTAYQQSLEIIRRLAEQDPTNRGWQSDLSKSYERVGDVLRDQGDLAGALNSYRDSLAIREKLAKQDPSNASWQSDLSSSYERVGDVLRDQGDLAGALNSYRDSIAIREKLAKQNPSNASWQSDLSSSYEKAGDVLRDRGDWAGVLNLYRDSLAIRERLAKQDPGNAGWQRNLSISYDRVGDGLRERGDLAGALNSHRQSLAIRERLAKQDPGNAGWQRNLSISYETLGDVLRDQGDWAGALNSYRDSLTIREKLAKQDTGNASWQSDLAFLYISTGTTLARAEPKSKTEAREMIRKAQDIVRSLKERTDLTAQQQGWLHAIESALHEVGD
jgi:tetratricopeptide (TPR) repeat protein